MDGDKGDAHLERQPVNPDAITAHRVTLEHLRRFADTTAISVIPPSWQERGVREDGQELIRPPQVSCASG